MYNDLAYYDVCLYAPSSFVVQMGHIFISWHFYSSYEVSCGYHLTSVHAFYISRITISHITTNCGEITSLTTSHHHIKQTILQLASYVCTHSTSCLSSSVLFSSLSSSVCPTVLTGWFVSTRVCVHILLRNNRSSDRPTLIGSTLPNMRDLRYNSVHRSRLRHVSLGAVFHLTHQNVKF